MNSKTKFISNGARKIFLLSAVLLVAPVVALAQGFVPLAPIPGLTSSEVTSVVNSASLATFFNNLYKYSIGLAAALAVIQIIWAGLDIAFFHKDAVSALEADKGKIYNAVFGLVLVLSPVLVFSIINPSILNLSLNLPELKTASGPPAGITTGGTLPICGAAETTGCTKPVCDSYRTTNCIPKSEAVNAVASGLYPSPQSGGYCYQITHCTTSACKTACGNAGCDYNCGNQTQCEATLKEEVRGTTVPTSASCALYQI